MFRYAALLLLPLLSLSSVASETAATTPALPSSHQKHIPALLELLTQTEQALSSCTDAATTTAALPRLQELAEQTRQLAANQQTLPEPTVQDYLAAHPHVAEFNKLWEAICGHIERMELNHLITPELRTLLKLAPQSAGSATHKGQ